MNNFNYINWKSVDVVLGIRTQARRMVGADNATELWRPLKLITWEQRINLLESGFKMLSTILTIICSICLRLILVDCSRYWQYWTVGTFQFYRFHLQGWQIFEPGDDWKLGQDHIGRKDGDPDCLQERGHVGNIWRTCESFHSKSNQ